MKKMFIVALVTAFALAACGGEKKDAHKPTGGSADHGSAAGSGDHGSGGGGGGPAAGPGPEGGETTGPRREVPSCQDFEN